LKCDFCDKSFDSRRSLSQHRVRCSRNPDRVQATHSEETKLKIASSSKGKRRSLTDSHRASISTSMKVAHAKGTAWNIGRSRWNNRPSYPETFFMGVIENEFLDKNFEREYPVGVYSIDFAWVHKKLAIEIDGDQHQRFEEYKERDVRKDAKLRDEGWKVLRISWKEMFLNPKEKIAEAKSFVDDWV
jgi:very-short-patch-repair endonuclease